MPPPIPTCPAIFDDLVAVYRAEIAELAAAGCQYLQLDEVPVAMLCDEDVRRQAAGEGGNPAALLDTYLGLLQRILANCPAGMATGLHLCRGNFRGRWMAAGGYEPVAERLFNEVPVDAFFLEYDSERAGDFQPLRFVPKGKRVVLGLVSSKTPELEDRRPCSAASTRRQGSARWTSSRSRPSAALPASLAATPSRRTGSGRSWPSSSIRPGACGAKGSVCALRLCSI